MASMTIPLPSRSVPNERAVRALSGTLERTLTIDCSVCSTSWSAYAEILYKTAKHAARIPLFIVHFQCPDEITNQNNMFLKFQLSTVISKSPGEESEAPAPKTTLHREGNMYFRGRGIFFTTRCRVIACRVYQRQLPYNLLPAAYNIHCPKNQQRLLPFPAAVANCLLEAPGRSSCREKNTPTPDVFKIIFLEPTLKNEACRRTVRAII